MFVPLKLKISVFTKPIWLYFLENRPNGPVLVLVHFFGGGRHINYEGKAYRG